MSGEGEAWCRGRDWPGGADAGRSTCHRSSTTGTVFSVTTASTEEAAKLSRGSCPLGTLVRVIDETRLFEDQPEFAPLLSWHIADELIPKLRERGFKGKFIVPLPEPRIVT